jgi:hypothetical protein
VKVLTNMSRCKLQCNNLEKLIFVKQNWPNDFRLNYNSRNNSIKLIETLQLKEKLKGFEGAFGQVKM